MKELFRKIWFENPKVRKIVGWTLIILGVVSAVTPFTPFGFFLILGLEILGIRFLFWDKLKNWFKR